MELIGYFWVVFAFEGQQYDFPHLGRELVDGVDQDAVALLGNDLVVKEGLNALGHHLVLIVAHHFAVLQLVERTVAHGGIEKRFHLVQVNKVVAVLPLFHKTILNYVGGQVGVLHILVGKHT